MPLIVVETQGKQALLTELLRKAALPEEWSVVSCNGHYSALPKNSLGIDPNHEFQMTWKIRDHNSYSKLSKKMEETDTVFACTDISPEGEMLASQIYLTASFMKRTCHRMFLRSLDLESLREAILHPSVLSQNRVDAYLARECISRFVNFMLSPILESKLGPGVSLSLHGLPILSELARVERKFRRFSPDKRWIARALLSDGSIAESGPLSEGDAQRVVERAKAAVPSFTSAKEISTPPPPFTLSSLTQFLNRRYALDTLSCVRACEMLYSLGHITYPFTDSDRMDSVVASHIRDFIREKLSSDYLSDSDATNSAVHDSSAVLSAICPTIVGRLPSQLDLATDLKTVYSAVWFRALGSQGKPALLSRQECRFYLGDSEAFCANGLIIEDSGWHQLSGRIFEPTVHPLASDASVVEASVRQTLTRPPVRHTHGSLIAWLDSHFLGSPCTYRSSFDFLNSNSYVEMLGGGQLRITARGEAVLTFMRRTVPDLLDPDFGSEVEEDIRAVDSGTSTLRDLLGSYWAKVNDSAISMQKKVLRPAFASPATGSRLQVSLDKETGRPYVSAPNEDWFSFVEFDAKGKIVLAKEGT